jgi:hypothetical protein
VCLCTPLRRQSLPSETGWATLCPHLFAPRWSDTLARGIGASPGQPCSATESAQVVAGNWSESGRHLPKHTQWTRADERASGDSESVRDELDYSTVTATFGAVSAAGH